MIKHTMNIGCLCEGMIFADVFGTRIKGPVDNFEGYNFKSTLKIFDGSLFNAILSNKIDSKEYDDYDGDDKDGDGIIRYYLSESDVKWGERGQSISGDFGWKVIHNNLEEDKNKIEFINRINRFNEFINKREDNSYYIYTISANDSKLSEADFNYTVNHLPSNIIDKLLIIGAVRYSIPKLFYENFRCIDYNNDLSGEHKLPKEVDWWNI